MLQSERLNVVEKTLDTIFTEMEEGRIDEGLGEIARVVQVDINRIVAKIQESEE